MIDYLQVEELRNLIAKLQAGVAEVKLKHSAILTTAWNTKESKKVLNYVLYPTFSSADNIAWSLGSQASYDIRGYIVLRAEVLDRILAVPSSYTVWQKEVVITILITSVLDKPSGVLVKIICTYNSNYDENVCNKRTGCISVCMPCYNGRTRL